MALLIPVGREAPQLGRLDRRLLIVALSLLVLVGAGGSGLLLQRTWPQIGLHQSGVALGAGGLVIEISAGEALVPGTRVLDGTPDSARLAAEQLSWLAAGSVPQVDGVDPSMVSGALLDLHVLSRTHGVPVAGQSAAWRYVWPRDSALVAVAFSRTGHFADAERVLDFLQRVQPASGVFEARYRPDGSGVPDGRGVQLDGAGWALWALVELVNDWPASERPALLARHRPLLDRSAQALLAAVDNHDHLPAPSSDYWEVREQRRTLSTAALVRAGLEAAGTLYASVGETGAAQTTEGAERRVAAAIRTDFGRDGYPRHEGGRSDSVDLGAAFLLPPFGRAAPDVVAAWRHGSVLMRRPAGGLAPGGSWRRDGVSWTNATASYAMTAAALGDDPEAVRWLGWLAAHRTPTGALPEKVLADGSPAFVAPLAWTAAAVIIATTDLAR